MKVFFVSEHDRVETELPGPGTTPGLLLRAALVAALQRLLQEKLPGQVPAGLRTLLIRAMNRFKPDY
jgi:hypothetical protein